MPLSPEIRRLGSIITDKLVMKIWIFLRIMKNFTHTSHLSHQIEGEKKNHNLFCCGRYCGPL